MMKTLKSLLPLAIFLGMAALLFRGLGLDPSKVPSPLIGHPSPQFRLPELTDPARMVTTQDLMGQVALFNVWATWCVSCRQEHAMLMQLAQRHVPIYGLDYKDDRAEALDLLQRDGNPYVANAFDAEGRVGIDWGVYGTPETFLIDRRGRIRYKHIGPITEQDAQEFIWPWIEKLRAEGPSPTSGK